MKKKLLGSIIVGLSVALGCVTPAMADSRKVVTLGADLTQEQQNTMMKYFGVSYDGVDLLYINNTDEREHLGSYVPLEQIGNYTYSCALVSPTSSGGIQVKTANLDWVTCNMIASTLSTSGVTNCQVVAACPFKVSGTGALTGVIMAYETASKETLDPVKVDLANQELVTTGNLANEVGQSKATAIINETKIKVIENNITNIEEITNIVNNVSNNYGVSVSPDQSEVIGELMQKIAEQEYDITQLKATLDRVQANVAGDAGASEEEQKAAEEQAEASQKAADEAAKAEAEQQTEVVDGIIVETGDTTEETENILENTDISVLEEESGVKVEEGDTTTTVLEQSEAQETEDNGLGIPEATDDGTMTNTQTGETEVLQTEAGITAETEALQTEAGITVETENPAGEMENPAVETEAAEPERKAEDLAAEDKAVYDEVKADLDQEFNSTEIMNEDGSYTVYLTEDAAKKIPEKVEAYLLKVLADGTDAVAMEEAMDPAISQNVMEETAAQAPDKNYEDGELKQVDKYVRRLIFKDAENILADSYLEDSDEVFLYNEIMKALEKAYKVDTAQEEVNAETSAEELPEETDFSEEAPAEEDFGEDLGEEAEDAGMEDEFADFEVEEGSF